MNVHMGATQRDLHIDRALSEMAIGYRPEGFIADMIFPIVRVGNETNTYYVFSRADMLRQERTHRSRGTRANQVTIDVSSDTYACRNYALGTGVPIEDRANADPLVVNQLFNGSAQYLLDKLFLDYDIRVASLVNSTTNVGSSTAVASGWLGSGADPLGDLNTAIDNVRYANGVRPNRLVFGPKAWDSCRRHSTVLNKLYGTNNGGGYANQAQIASLLEIEKIEVSGAFQNTGEEGLTESLSTVWGDNVLVYYAPMAPTIMKPSFGYSYRWSAPGIPQMQVERYPYDPKLKADEIEVGYHQDEKITGASYAFLVVAVNSST